LIWCKNLVGEEVQKKKMGGGLRLDPNVSVPAEEEKREGPGRIFGRKENQRRKGTKNKGQLGKES